MLPGARLRILRWSPSVRQCMVSPCDIYLNKSSITKPNSVGDSLSFSTASKKIPAKYKGKLLGLEAKTTLLEQKFATLERRVFLVEAPLVRGILLRKMLCVGLGRKPQTPNKGKDYSAPLNSNVRNEFTRFGLESPEQFDLFAKEINSALHHRNDVVHSISPVIAATVINNIQGNPEIVKLLKLGFKLISKRPVEDIDKFSEEEKNELVGDGLYTAPTQDGSSPDQIRLV